MAKRITEEDEGKKVVNSAGDTVGVISGFRGGTAYVDPDPGLTDKLRARLGWEHIDEDDYPLDETKVETVTDDEIRLKSDLQEM
ncbi:PRC-barrel domain containing protein [Haloarchaeobius sp. HRN-SO-5]|uniref:PRC-barrel domain containing protein n=1 Tax=Haloarchaeobius sp. HRN-SO-5 TaxID=3446118 RepID=UPI003EC0C6B9